MALLSEGCRVIHFEVLVDFQVFLIEKLGSLLRESTILVLLFTAVYVTGLVLHLLAGFEVAFRRRRPTSTILLNLLSYIIVLLKVHVVNLAPLVFALFDFLIIGKLAEILIEFTVFFDLGVILVLGFFSDSHGAHNLHALHHHLGGLLEHSACSEASEHHGRVKLVHAVNTMNAHIHLILRASDTVLVDLRSSFVMVVLLAL